MNRFAHNVLNQKMAEYGWIITGVPGKALYTVGLSSLNHPELMIHGMDANQAGSLLQVAALHVINKNYVYSPGLHSNIVAGYAVLLIQVDPSNFNDWLGQAADYVGPDLQVLQILWPDKESRFPGDSTYDKKHFGAQLRFDVRRPEYAYDGVIQ